MTILSQTPDKDPSQAFRPYNSLELSVDIERRVPRPEDVVICVPRPLRSLPEVIMFVPECFPKEPLDGRSPLASSIALLATKLAVRGSISADKIMGYQARPKGKKKCGGVGGDLPKAILTAAL